MIEKAIAFLDNLTLEELDRLPPARRQKFSELCYHWHKLAEARPKEPKTGVLRDLKDGRRPE
jgi:hypothetical protein